MTPPLTITIPVSLQTFGLVTSLLKHLAFLGPIPGHPVLFVADHGLSRETLQPILDAAKPIFPSGGSLIHTALPNLPPYPHAHNHRFETAARHIATNVRTPWLWLDPHCVPTRKGWIVELETEYRAHAHLKPILGQLLTPVTHSTAQDLVSGIAIYPADLPKRIVQRLIARRDTDWERSCADIIIPISHHTQLIWVHGVDGSKTLPKPPQIASLVHTAMAKAYAESLRGDSPVTTPAPISKPEPVKPPEPQPEAVDDDPKSSLSLPPSRAAFYHSGDLGDIIYSLAAIRLAGGGALLLGPRVNNTPPPVNPIKEPVFDLLKPLLDLQPYITRSAFQPAWVGPHRAFDLNIYRRTLADKELRERTGISTIIRAHCHVLGVDEKFHPSDAWLNVPVPIKTNLFTIHRTPRYRSDNFPWDQICKRYRKRLLFVGLPSEHAEFQRGMNIKTAFWLCEDFLDMARVISGSLGFIGSQSLPNALALACGQRVLQEHWPTSPDCIISRPNFLTQPFTEAALDAWEASPAIEFGAERTPILNSVPTKQKRRARRR